MTSDVYCRVLVAAFLWRFSFFFVARCSLIIARPCTPAQWKWTVTISRGTLVFVTLYSHNDELLSILYFVFLLFYYTIVVVTIVTICDVVYTILLLLPVSLLFYFNIIISFIFCFLIEFSKFINFSSLFDCKFSYDTLTVSDV